jgi:RHS repeat-associated protein
MFGQGWMSNLEERLQIPDLSDIFFWRADGNAWAFQADSPSNIPNGASYSLQAPNNEIAVLVYDNTSTLYTMTFLDSSKEVFDSLGYLLSRTDRNGNTYTLSYNTSKQLVQITGAGGQTVNFSYSNSQFPNLATSAQDGTGPIASYSYTGTLLSQVTYPDSSALQYGYDSQSNIVSVTDVGGKPLESHTYDSLGRGLSSSRAIGVDYLTVQYNSDGSTTLTDSKGNSTMYSFQRMGGRNRVSTVTGSACSSCGTGGPAAFNYNSDGTRSASFDANGNATYFTENPSTLTVSLKYQTVTSNGQSQNLATYYDYNSFGEALDVTDPLGNVTTNTYDANGNLLTTTTPSPDGTSPGSTTTFTYDSKGELLTVTDPRNNTTTMAYTPAGMVTSITDAQGHVTSFTYDGRGNRISVTDATNQTTNFTFDAMNRLTRITNPDSSVTQFAYDTRGRRTSVTDANAKTTSYAYDDADRLISVTDAAGHATAYAYDTENNLTAITDAAGHATGYAYDANRRVLQTTFPSALTETYSYDADGNLLTKTDRKGNTVTYTYDELSRLVQKSYPDSTAVNYVYDMDSHLTQASDTTGTYNLVYDGMGRLTQSSTQYSFLSAQTLVNNYTYDANSNRASFANPQGGATSYSYDSLNRLASVTDFAGRLFSFSYDALGRRTGLTRPNGVNTSYTYDSLSRLLSVLHQTGNTTLDGASYAYDAAGNRTSKTALPANLTSAYSYDPVYELTKVLQGATTKESYTYDAVGNRTYQPGAPYTYNSSNEMLTREGVPYTYDADGNTLSKTNGSGTTSYAWDFENRLTSVTLPGTGGTVSFKYDPFGRRIQKTNASGATAYVYDGDNIVEELTGSSGTIAERYTYGPGIDEPLVGQRQPLIFYYEADGLGSVTSMTTPTGSIAATYTYDSFGFLTASTGSATNWYRYTARQFDSDTALYYNRARYYDPTTGRFLSEDPIRFKDGANFYSYVHDSPPDFTDPSGLATLVILSGSVDSNPFGHIAVATTGAGVYSYGTSQPYGSSLDSFLQSQLANRNVQLLIFDTTPAQEATIQASMAQNNRGNYSVFSHNCATAVGTALNSAGVGNLNGDDLPFLPGALFYQLLSSPGSQYTWLPQGSAVPGNLGSFNPKH